MTRARAIENSPPARTSTGRFEEQLDRHGYRGGTHAVAAKVSEMFFDADEGAASTRKAKMHEADGFPRPPPAPRFRDLKAHVGHGMREGRRAMARAASSLTAPKASKSAAKTRYSISPH
jgi:hypothetical protein